MSNPNTKKKLHQLVSAIVAASVLSLLPTGCGDPNSTAKKTGDPPGANAKEPDKTAGNDPTPNSISQAPESMNISKSEFGEVDGTKVDLYTMTNGNLEVAIMTYGGAIVSLKAPDKDGKLADVVLGFSEFEGYLQENNPYFGCITGRYANRIAKGKFSIDGQEYTLAINNAPNSLHGGAKGFNKRVWAASEIESSDSVGVAMTYESADGEEGYPGKLSCKVTYTLNTKNELAIKYEATTDKTTVINLTNHTYWNLKGEGTGDILGHELMLKAKKFTPVDATSIPTGLIASVAETPLEFDEPTAIGKRIDEPFPQLVIGKGYDHNWVLDSQDGSLAPAARMHEPTSGRVMEILTTEPGIQFYTGNFLDGSITGKSGNKYEKRHGFCLETQHFPDSPNHPQFPSTLLKPGEKYETATVHRFSVAQ